MSAEPKREPVRVAVTDVKISFFSLVTLFVKAAIAAIPAAIILTVIVATVWLVVGVAISK